MINAFLFGAVIAVASFLLLKNIVVFDLLGIEHPFLKRFQTFKEENVQNTCRLVSGWRAMDSQRENSHYFQKDPLAIFFAGEEVMSVVQSEAPGIFRDPEPQELHSITLRQLAIDRRIEQYCSSLGTDAEVPIRQVVLLGAGMDVRPYRLALPQVHWFEVDTPEVLSLKEALLTTVHPSHVNFTALRVKQCSRIAFNVTTETELLKNVLAMHGHDSTQPTLFILEGLVMYLTPSEIRSLMDSLLPAAAARSRVIISQVSFLYHYLLTNPLVTLVIEMMSPSQSHKVAALFKSNMYSMDMGAAWSIEHISNVGVEMRDVSGLTQWQPLHHKAGTPPLLTKTAENLLDVVLTNDSIATTGKIKMKR